MKFSDEEYGFEHNQIQIHMFLLVIANLGDPFLMENCLFVKSPYDIYSVKSYRSLSDYNSKALFLSPAQG